MSYKCISIEQAKELIENNEVILADIRDAESFSAGHIENAVSLSNDNIADFLLKTDKSLALITYCYHGNTSKGASTYFFEQGFKEVYSMDGGFEAWRQKY